MKYHYTCYKGHRENKKCLVTQNEKNKTIFIGRGKGKNHLLHTGSFFHFFT